MMLHVGRASIAIARRPPGNVYRPRDLSCCPVPMQGRTRLCVSYRVVSCGRPTSCRRVLVPPTWGACGCGWRRRSHVVVSGYGGAFSTRYCGQELSASSSYQALNRKREAYRAHAGFAGVCLPCKPMICPISASLTDSMQIAASSTQLQGHIPGSPQRAGASDLVHQAFRGRRHLSLSPVRAADWPPTSSIAARMQ